MQHLMEDKMTRMRNTWISRLPRRMALIGLAIAVLGAGAVPLLGGQDAEAVTFQTITKTFTNNGPIAIASSGIANPYPSPIVVSGLEQGQVLDVNVKLNGFSHGFAADVDVLLVHNNVDLVVMSDA